jgi:hypothetical protein
MWATTVPDQGTAPPRTRRATPPRSTEPIEALATAGPSVTVTVQIDLNGDQVPPAALGLIESLRALAGPTAVTVDGLPAQREPAPVEHEPVGRLAGLRPRLVRRTSDAGGPSLRVYLASRLVLKDGSPVRLTRREYDLLVFLCEHPRRVFSRTQLLRQVWGYEMVSGERTVDVHVRRLRVKLGDRGPVIATVRGVGYRLDEATQVTVVSEPD